MQVIIARMKAKPEHKQALVATMVEDARASEPDGPLNLR